jgi:hypothetical protein
MRERISGVRHSRSCLGCGTDKPHLALMLREFGAGLGDLAHFGTLGAFSLRSALLS